jgi:hypothetical protein
MVDTADAALDRSVEQTYWDVGLRSDGIVWLSRRSESFPSLDALHQSYDEFLSTVDDWVFERRIKAGQLGTRVRSPIAWLCDLRDAPDLRNDEDFEAAIKKRRPELLERSPVMAVLVKSNAGQMQLRRITRDEHSAMGVFDDADAALLWLAERIRQSFPPESFRGSTHPASR